MSQQKPVVDVPINADPGNGGALQPVGGQVRLVSAGAETRSLNNSPVEEGADLLLCVQAFAGNIVLTSSLPLNVVGQLTITFSAAGQWALLRSMKIGAVKLFRVIAVNGAVVA